MARVWGSNRFGSDDPPIGEIWAVHEDNRIESGPGKGGTLRDAVARYGEKILGARLAQRGEDQFPLLFKLIEANSWLSIQVHPDDPLAVELEGPGHRGKTEAWYVIEAEPGAEIIAGVVRISRRGPSRCRYPERGCAIASESLSRRSRVTRFIFRPVRSMR